MRKHLFKLFLVGFVALCLVIGNLGRIARAETDDDDDDDRQAAWHQTQTGTNPWGGTWISGRFGPDVGYGEQGSYYSYQDPMSGNFITYSQVGMGMGMGGPLMGYGGWNSPLAGISYGPYAGGNMPQMNPTPGWSTQGYYSGGLFSPQISYTSGQYNPIAGLFMGLLGGGLGGWGGSYGGWGGGLGGWGGSLGGWGGSYGSWGGSYGGGYPTVIR